jgi:hypothetical protein
MAKTKVTTRKFYVVDLVRYKPKTKYLQIDPTRVDIQIDVTTKGILSASEVPSAAMDRLEKAARGALDGYEKTIASEVERLETKIQKMIDSGDPKEMEAATGLIQGVNVSIKNALANAEGAAKKAVDDRLKAEIQGDKNLKEAQVKLGFKIVVGMVSVTTQVAALVASHGADVHAYYSIAKTVYEVGKEIYEYNKGEARLRQDLDTAIKAFISLRGNTLMQAAARQMVDTSGLTITKPVEALKEIVGRVQKAGAEALKGRDAKAVLVEVMDFTVKAIKSQMADVEKARTAYRNHVVKTRHKVDTMSVSADKLMKAMKSATNLKDGVKIGAKCMSVKSGVTAMARKLEEREAYLTEMQDLMKGNGLTIDDRTALQKIKELDIDTILSEGKLLYEAATEVKDLIEAFV